MKFRILVAVFAVLVLIAGATSPGIGQPYTNAPAVLKQPKSTVTGTVYPITWRNAANPDTVIRVFNGPAAVTNDTSRTTIPIWGATTVSVQNKFTVVADSALVLVYAQISNDGSKWAYVGQKALALDTTQVGAIDSSGAWNTTGAVGITHVVSFATQPTYARYLRLIVKKLASEVTDTMKVQTWVHVIQNDE